MPTTPVAWAAVLYAEPAYLCWTSMERPKGRDADGPIHVAIDSSRRVRSQEGLVIHRLASLAPRTYGGTPPRLNLEDNALLMAHGARREIDAIAAFAQVVSRSYVTSATLRAALERPHGLPAGERQALRSGPSGNQFRDVEYAAYGLVVELDGALGHESWRDQARDADRYLDDLARLGSVTARLRWHQVFDTPCRTAGRIGRIIAGRGWTGAVIRCGDACDVAAG